MPDNVQNPQGTPGQATPAPQNTPEGTPQQSQEPQWFQHVPEQYREEAKKGWMQHGDYTKKTTEIADRQKAWEKEKTDLETKVSEYNNWLQNQYSPFYQRLQSKWKDIEPILNGQVPQQPQGQQQAQNPFENWDLLPPQDQAKRIAEFNQNQYAQSLQQLEQRWNEATAQREKYYTDYLATFTDALLRKIQDPSLDFQGFMKQALDIKQGRVNPLEMAYNNMKSPEQLKQVQDEYYKKGKEEAALEFQNRQQSNGAFQNQGIPLFKQQPKSREEVTEAARQQFAKNNLPWS